MSSSPSPSSPASGASTPTFRSALIAGGLAGTTVDLTLFPLDTLKTRLQSASGFFAAGGFNGIYRGVGSALVGSAPGAAFFFCTYEAVKKLLLPAPPNRRGGTDDNSNSSTSTTTTHPPLLAEAAVHMAAASLGEVAACAVRVPTEVVKQRAQAGLHGGSSAAALAAILAQHQSRGTLAVWRELYRGWTITVFREVPFTVIQFPLWEALKAWRRRTRAPSPNTPADLPALESALFGSLSGAVAAALTTPLDVVKTRVMLSKDSVSIATVFRTMLRDQGIRPFFAGIMPRVTWISLGGAIFLGSYQWATNLMASFP